MGGARDLERRLAEARGRATALADALAVMSRAPTDLVAVLETVLDRAANMCDAERFATGMFDEAGWERPSWPSEAARTEFGRLVASAARPIDDVRGTAAYRRQVLSVMGARAIARVAELT